MEATWQRARQGGRGSVTLSRGGSQLGLCACERENAGKHSETGGPGWGPGISHLSDIQAGMRKDLAPPEVSLPGTVDRTRLSLTV